MYSEVGMKYKRRVLQKTNYKKRYALLKRGTPRLVIRLSNMYIGLQYVTHNAKGDESKISVLSKALTKYGFEGAVKNISASYLTGYLFGKMVQKENLSQELIFDIGLHNAHRGGRIFAALKGAIDSGLNIAASEDAFPDQNRINGAHNGKEALFKKVKATIDKGI